MDFRFLSQLLGGLSSCERLREPISCILADDQYGESEPFRAFFGAILSTIENVSVDPSTFKPSMELDTIVEGEDDDFGPLSENDIDGCSGPYRSRSSKWAGTSTKPSLRCRIKHARDGDSESGLMVRPFRLFLHYHMSR